MIYAGVFSVVFKRLAAAHLDVADLIIGFRTRQRREFKIYGYIPIASLTLTPVCELLYCVLCIAYNLKYYVYYVLRTI